jgi:hypothetical protein
VLTFSTACSIVIPKKMRSAKHTRSQKAWLSAEVLNVNFIMAIPMGLFVESRFQRRPQLVLNEVTFD